MGRLTGLLRRFRFSRSARPLLWITLFASAGGAALNVDFNLYLLHAGRSESLLGALAAAGSAASALAALPSGWLADRIGRRDMLLVAGALGGAAQLAQIFWPQPAVLLPAAWVGGAATVALGIVVAPLLAERSRPEERQDLFSAVFAVGLAAGVAGNLLGGWLPEQVAGLGPLAADRLTLLAATGVQLLALPAVLTLPSRPAPAPHAGGRRLLPRLPAALPRLVVPEILIGLGAGMFIPFYNVFLARRLGASTGAIGAIFSIQSLVTAGCALLGPAVARRLGRVPAIASLEVGSLPFMVGMTRSRSLRSVALLGFARSGLMNAAGPLLGALEMEAVAEDERGITNAVIGMAANGASAGGNWIGGRLMPTSLAVPYLVAAPLYAAAAASAVILLRKLPGAGRPPAAEAGADTTPARP